MITLLIITYESFCFSLEWVIYYITYSQTPPILDDFDLVKSFYSNNVGTQHEFNDFGLVTVGTQTDLSIAQWNWYVDRDIYNICKYHRFISSQSQGIQCNLNIVSSVRQESINSIYADTKIAELNHSNKVLFPKYLGETYRWNQYNWYSSCKKFL